VQGNLKKIKPLVFSRHDGNVARAYSRCVPAPETTPAEQNVSAVIGEAQARQNMTLSASARSGLRILDASALGRCASVRARMIGFNGGWLWSLNRGRHGALQS
jgi:hypothetical protein